MKLPDYLRVRNAWKDGVQDVPLFPATILVDDIDKVMVVRLEHPESSEKDQYPACPYPPSHHLD